MWVCILAIKKLAQNNWFKRAVATKELATKDQVPKRIGLRLGLEFRVKRDLELVVKVNSSIVKLAFCGLTLFL